jgi:hypothetical protein
MKRSLSFTNLSDLEENKILQPDVRKSKSMNSVPSRHLAIEHEALDELLECYENELQQEKHSSVLSTTDFSFPSSFNFDFHSKTSPSPYPPRISTQHIHQLLNGNLIQLPFPPKQS